MAKWTRGQIQAMALATGWGARSKDVSYVAMAESSGDDKVVNEIGCVGLLQINQPVHVGSHPKWTTKWLQDPMNNLRAGLVLYKGAGQKFDGPWLDSKNKGDGGGWGSKVSGGSGGVDQVEDKDEKDEGACEWLDGPAKEYCMRDDGQDMPDDTTTILDTAEQIGRLAQAVAKAGNWMSDPANWGRVVYIVGGGLLVLTAINVVLRPVLGPVARYMPLPSMRSVKTFANDVRTSGGTETVTRHSKE